MSKCINFLVTAMAFLSLTNHCPAQSEPLVPVDLVQQAMAPIQTYLSSFKPRPALKPITNALSSCAGNSSLATEANFGGGKIQTINGLVYAWRSQINTDGSECGALDIASERSVDSRVSTRFLTRDEFQQLETVSALVATPNPTLANGLFAFSFAPQPCDSASPANGNLFAATPYVAVTSTALGSGISAQGGCLIANDDVSTPPLNRIALSEAAVGAVSYVRMSNPLFDGSNVPLYFSSASQLPQGNGGATYHDMTGTFLVTGSFFNANGLNYDIHLSRSFSACPLGLPQPQRGGPIFGLVNNGAGSIVSVISDVAKVCDTDVSLFYHRYDGPHLQSANYTSLLDFIGGGGAPNPITILLPSDNALINGASTTLKAAAADCAGGKIVAWKSTNRVTGQVVQLGQSSTCIITAQVPAGSQYITAYRAGTRWSKTVLVTSDRPQAQLTLSATAITLQPTQASAPLTINWQSSDLGGYPLILTRQIGAAQESLIQQANSGQFTDSIAVSSSTTYTYRLRRELSAGNYETLTAKDVQVTRIVQYPDFIGVSPLYLRLNGACFNEDIPVNSQPSIHFSHNIATGAVLTMNGQILTTTTPSQTSYAPGTYVVSINQFPGIAFSEYGSGVGFNHSNMNICIAEAATGRVQQCTTFWLSIRVAPNRCARHNTAPIIGSIDLSANSPVIISPGTTQSQTISWVSQNAEQISVTEQVDGGQETVLSENFSGIISRPYNYSNTSRQFTYRIKGVFAGEDWLLGEKIVEVLPSTTSPAAPNISFRSLGYPYVNGGTSYRYILEWNSAPELVTYRLEYANSMSSEYTPINLLGGVTSYESLYCIAPYVLLPGSTPPPLFSRRARVKACRASTGTCSDWSTVIFSTPSPSSACTGA